MISIQDCFKNLKAAQTQPNEKPYHLHIHLYITLTLYDTDHDKFFEGHHLLKRQFHMHSF